jgi:hypothetical protein
MMPELSISVNGKPPDHRAGQVGRSDKPEILDWFTNSFIPPEILLR